MPADDQSAIDSLPLRTSRSDGVGEHILTELVDVDSVLCEEYAHGVRRAHSKAATDSFSASATAEPSSDGISRITQYAVQQVFGLDLDQLSFAGSNAGDLLRAVDQIRRAAQGAVVSSAAPPGTSPHLPNCFMNGQGSERVFQLAPHLPNVDSELAQDGRVVAAHWSGRAHDAREVGASRR